MIGHPREELLLAFQDHRLDDQRRRRLAGHLSGCQRCRNVVQAHRTVRGVFALEAPFAPDGVLERALASRAAGMLVMLPVAEPDVGRRLELPSRGFLLAVGVVLAVGVGVQVVPMGRVQQVWQVWSAVLTDWNPGDGHVLSYPRAPVAPAATIVPTRLRAHTAVYRSIIHQGEAPNFVRSMRLQLIANPDGWTIMEHEEGRYDLELTTDRALRPIQWHFTTGLEAERFPTRHQTFTLVGNSAFAVTTRFVAKPGKAMPPNLVDFDSSYAMTQQPVQPFTIGNAHFYVFLQGLQLRRGWIGSIANSYIVTDRRGFPRYAISYIAQDGGIVTTPAGQFDTWVLSPPQIGFLEPERLWVRKSDGLLVRRTSGRGEYAHEVLLESVTFP